jgi:hypothetical protein
MIVLQLTQLANALNLNKGYVSKLSKKAWWPPKTTDGWDVEACRRALAENIRQRSGADEAQAAQEPPTPRIDPSDGLVATLLRGDASPLEISRAAVQLAARTYGQGLVSGSVGARALDELKRALEELRRGEEDYLSLEIRRGLLIPRDVAKAVAGGLAGRLVGVLNNVESMLETQVEIWIGDLGFRDLPTETRRRQVREWFDAHARSLRMMEADEIEAMVAEEISDRQRDDA